MAKLSTKDFKGGLFYRQGKGQPRLIEPRVSVADLRSEYESQVAFVQWCRWSARLAQHVEPEKAQALLWLFSVPNGLFFGPDAQVRAIIGRKAVASGLTKGVYDLYLAWPGQGFHGCFIEMKAGKNDLTEEQREFRQAMILLGYQCLEFWRWEAAAQAVVSFMGLKKHGEIPPF